MAGSTLVFVSVSMLPLSLVEMSSAISVVVDLVDVDAVVDVGDIIWVVVAAVEVGAQSGQRNELEQHPLGQLLKQLVSIEPEYSPCPRHITEGVSESGKLTFRSWLLLM